jgi:hypothetical protein
MLRDGLFGVTTALGAANCTGMTLPSVKAATTILETGDDSLAVAVLKGQQPLLKTAARIRSHARLISDFLKASPEGRAALAPKVAAIKGSFSAEDVLALTAVVEKAAADWNEKIKTNGAAVHS